LGTGLQPANGEDMKLHTLSLSASPAAMSSRALSSSNRDALVGSVIGPELFEIVEAPDFRPEDVDDDVAGIDQHPIGVGQAFDLQIPAPVMLEPFDQLVGNGADMTVGAAGSDDHFIGDDGLPIEIDGYDVLGLGILELAENGGEERVLRLALWRRLHRN